MLRKWRKKKVGERTKGKREARENERKKLERQKERKAKEKLLKKAKKPRTATKRALSPVDTVRLESLFVQVNVEGNGQYSSCGMVFSQEDDEDRFWVCCDSDKWYCFACHKLLTKDSTFTRVHLGTSAPWH